MLDSHVGYVEVQTTQHRLWPRLPPPVHHPMILCPLWVHHPMILCPHWAHHPMILCPMSVLFISSWLPLLVTSQRSNLWELLVGLTFYPCDTVNSRHWGLHLRNLGARDISYSSHSNFWISVFWVFYHFNSPWENNSCSFYFIKGIEEKIGFLIKYQVSQKPSLLSRCW